MAATIYEEYVRAEWALFSGDPSRWLSSLDVLPTLKITSVLDVGCGAGQELLPFVIETHRWVPTSRVSISGSRHPSIDGWLRVSSYMAPNADALDWIGNLSKPLAGKP